MKTDLSSVFWCGDDNFAHVHIVMLFTGTQTKVTPNILFLFTDQLTNSCAVTPMQEEETGQVFPVYVMAHCLRAGILLLLFD